MTRAVVASPPGHPADDSELGSPSRLVASADAERRRHPGRALDRARAARDFVATLEAVERVPWLRLQAAAWAVLASAEQGVGALVRAEEALRVAAAFLDQVPVAERDPLARADVVRRASRLRGAQGRLDEALALNTSALRAFEHAGQRQRAAAVLVDRGVLLHRAGRTRTALALVEKALEVIDPVVSPSAHRAAVHNLACYRLEVAGDLDELAEAFAALESAIAVHRGDPAPFALAKLRAILGRAALRLGCEREAAEAFEAAAETFLAFEATAEAAHASLERMAVLVEAGRRGEASRLATRLFKLLRRLQVPNREALVRQVHAAQGREVTLEEVRRIARQMEELAER